MSAPDPNAKNPVPMDTIVSLCKRRGFIFPGSEIYDGLAGTYDYGPLGSEFKGNVKRVWWREMVTRRDDMEGVDAALLMNPRVWEASGHTTNFNDPMCDCLLSQKRYRADHLEPTEGLQKWPLFKTMGQGDNPTRMALPHAILATSKKEAKKFVQKLTEDVFKGQRLSVGEPEGEPFTGTRSPDYGGPLTEPRQFNLMLKTHLGPAEDSSTQVYLRPETAQGIFTNFQNVVTTARRKVPFGIAQMGKSFRNEITPRNFIFRVREFEQMEIEFFVKPPEYLQAGEMDDMAWWEYWLEQRMNWYTTYGIRRENLDFHRHPDSDLAHYAKCCSDVMYLFPHGWDELEGIANRTDFDLKQHQEFSGKDQSYFDPATEKKFIPYVIEPSAGVDRGTLAFLIDAYREDEVKDKKRVWLKLHPALAPIKVAVLPLLKNRPEIVEACKKLLADLKRFTSARYDDTAAIGKLYRRQDEIGTPYCVTVDVDTVENDQKVTIRDRDTMEQIRVPLDEAAGYLRQRLLEVDAL